MCVVKRRFLAESSMIRLRSMSGTRGDSHILVPQTVRSLITVVLISDEIRLVALNPDPVLGTAGLGEVVGRLQPHPVVGRGPS